MSSLSDLLDALVGQPMSSTELQAALGVSQATVSRLLRRADGRVVRIGRGRSTRYALAEPVFGITNDVSIFEVTERGVVSEVGVLRALSGGAYYMDVIADRWWLWGHARDGVFESLPFFLYDLRPSGFLGRQVARRLSADGTYPTDPRNWTDADIGRFLLGHADDLPGNLVIGEAAARRVNRRTLAPVGRRAATYPELAVRALDDDAPGSSAAGEQPKFAVYQRDAGHVIVKFSPSARSAESNRWRDLLRAERHAQGVLADHGLPAAKAELFEFDGRVFLESQRFDRVEVRGRRPAISLTMVDAEFAGQAMGWSRVAGALRKSRLLDHVSFQHIVWAETFGTWIGNSDMHLGNISLAPTHDSFELLPIYDMLPMVLAPVRGELPKPRLSPPVVTSVNRDVWSAAGHAALAFWDRVQADPDMTRAFRRVAKHRLTRINELLSTKP